MVNACRAKSIVIYVWFCEYDKLWSFEEASARKSSRSAMEYGGSQSSQYSVYIFFFVEMTKRSHQLTRIGISGRQYGTDDVRDDANDSTGEREMVTNDAASDRLVSAGSHIGGIFVAHPFTLWYKIRVYNREPRVYFPVWKLEDADDGQTVIGKRWNASAKFGTVFICSSSMSVALSIFERAKSWNETTNSFAWIIFMDYSFDNNVTQSICSQCNRCVRWIACEFRTEQNRYFFVG